jgi:hypothetical protein
MGPGIFFSSILSIKCASTTYMNPFDMLRCEINAFINYAPLKKSWTQVPVASSAVDRGFEPRSGQTKDYKSGICCFSAKHAALRRKSNDGIRIMYAPFSLYIVLGKRLYELCPIFLIQCMPHFPYTLY